MCCNKLNTYLIIIFILIIVITSSSYSRTPDEIRREISVKFTDSIIIIHDSIEVGGKELIFLPEHEIGEALINSNLTEIRRAFPLKYWKDTIVYNDYGIEVKIPNFSDEYIISFPDVSSRDQYYEMLSGLSGIEYIEPNEPCELDEVIPNDPYFPEQWALHNLGTYNEFVTYDADIDAPEAWEIEKGDPNTIVAVVDVGVQKTHEDLTGKVLGSNTVHYHGTNVAGIIAANTDNNTGIAGINWYAKILNKAMDLSSDDIADKVIEAVNEGADILNNSYGGYGYSIHQARASAYAYKMDRVFVSSKGNNQTNDLHYPSDFYWSMAISSSTYNDYFYESYSNYGNGVDVCAPGGYVWSTNSYGDPPYYLFSGTSCAAPVVSGVASLLHSYNNQLSNDDIMNLIRYSAEDVFFPPASIGYDDRTGWGRVNAHNALQLLQYPNRLDHLTASDGIGDYVHGRFFYFWDMPMLPNGVHLVEVYEVRKAINFPKEFVSVPLVWGRNSASQGFTDDQMSFNYAIRYTGVVDGSITTTGCELVTYVYKTIPDPFWRWLPCPPEDVDFAYTTLGEYLHCCDLAGDADNSGAVNVADVVYIVDYLFRGGPIPPCPEEGDCSSPTDDIILVNDIVWLVNFLFKGGSAPVCPT